MKFDPQPFTAKQRGSYVNGEVSIELNTYRARLDLLMGVFGDNRILFGSDWPNSDGVAPADKIFTVAKEYFPGEAATDRREVFLEELGRRLQMDQARRITADAVIVGHLITPAACGFLVVNVGDGSDARRAC